MTLDHDAATASTEPNGDTRPSRLVIPTSLAQAGLWSVIQIFPDCLAYTGVIAYRIEGALDRDALRGALREVVRRHESLRTCFASNDGIPVQVIFSSSRLRLPMVDLRELAADAREARVRAHIACELQYRFDLERGPLVRATLLRCGDHDHVLVANIHRLLADFWSLGVLARDLNRAYTELAAGRRCDYPAPRLQYRHYAEWQNDALHRGAFDGAIEYWRKQLENLPPLLNIPTDRPRPDAHSFQGALVKFAVSPRLSRAVREFADANGMTPFAPFLAAFKVLMFRYSAQTDIVVGSPLAHRPRKSYEDVIGFFVNTLLLRTRIKPESSFEETAGEVWETILRALDHRDAPFEVLLRDLQPSRTLSYHTLFQVMFAMQNVPREHLRLADLNVAELEVPVITSKFDLMWSILEAGEAYEGTVEYDTDLFDRATVERMVEEYEILLASAIDSPGQPVSRLPLRTEREVAPVIRGTTADRRGGGEPLSTVESAWLGPSGASDESVRNQQAAFSDAASAASDEPLVSSLEDGIGKIWRELLDTEGIGPDDDFFALGGYSLLATRIIARINRAYAVQLPLRAMFDTRTIRSLSAVVETAIREKGQDNGTRIPRAPRHGVLPASFAQERMWFLSRRREASSAYNTQFLLHLRGELIPEALRESVRYLLRRHESLRTTFAVESYEIRQVIHERMDLEVPLFDMQGACERDVRAVVQEEQAAVFDLAAGPLLRVKLLKRSDSHHLLLVTIHHIVTDGWSMTVFIRDLAAAYSSFSAGSIPRLPELRVRYADYAVAQRARFESGAMSSELEYWKRRLQGVPHVLQLHASRPRPPSMSHEGGTVGFTVPEDLCSHLKLLAQRSQASLFMLMLSALQVLLHSHSGQEDMLVGVPVANRASAELENVIGPFVNTVVIRTRVSEATTFAEVLESVRRAALDAFARQELPFDKLVAELAPRRSSDRHPIFQIMFVFHEVPKRTFTAGPVTMELAIPEFTKSPFDMSLSVAEDGGSFRGKIVYSTDLFDEDYIHRLLEEYQGLLRKISSAA